MKFVLASDTLKVQGIYEPEVLASDGADDHALRFGMTAGVEFSEPQVAF